MSGKIELDWTSDSQAFLHDQYEALKDFLLYIEGLLHQHVNLYFTFQAAMLGLVGLVMADLPLDDDRRWPILMGLGLASLVMGVYTLNNILQCRYWSYTFKALLDSMTSCWVGQRSDVIGYYHLLNLRILNRHSNTRDHHGQTSGRRIQHSPLTLLKRISRQLGKARHRAKQSPQIIAITTGNSLTFAVLLYLLANRPEPMRSLLGSFGSLLQQFRLGRWQAVIWVAVLVWFLQISVCIWHKNQLSRRLNLLLPRLDQHETQVRDILPEGADEPSEKANA
jgi:hypothetical protein